MKRNKLYVAVTGGIGSGKSTVMQIIKEQGYPVFSADEIARHIYEEEDVLEQMRLAFPDCVSGRTIDRQKLARQVFADSEKLKLLDSITHPAVMKKLYAMMEQSEGAAAFAEVPLLFEGNYQKDFDRVIVLLRDKEKRILAAAERDDVSADSIRARTEHQFDYEKNSIIGHTLIYNDGDLPALRRRVLEVLNEIIGKENN